MSRRFGIIVLVLTFAYCGYILWRLAPKPHPNEAIKIRRVATDINTVQRDLCDFALAESDFRHKTGRYASIEELRSNGKAKLPPDGRYPYIYVLHDSSPQGFVIAAVSGQMNTDPRILTVDEQLQVQSRGKPNRIYPCEK